MRRGLAGLLFAALLGPALAADAEHAPTPAEAEPLLEVIPGRMGYAVDQPQILLRQRLFGRAHGLSLLAAACLDLPEHSLPTQDAYAAWHAGQAATIEAMAQDLSRHYFGPRAAEARWPDLVRALNLAEKIESVLGKVSLGEACASLPAAIAGPRYKLDKLLAQGDGADTGPAAGSANGRQERAKGGE